MLSGRRPVAPVPRTRPSDAEWARPHRRGDARLADLITSIDRIKHRCPSPKAALSEIAPRLERSVFQGIFDAYVHPHEPTRRYRRRLLSPPDAGFQLVLVRWAPGSESSIHDHDDLYGAVASVAAPISETKYTVLAEEKGRVKLQAASTQTLRRGTVSRIVPQNSFDIHKMSNHGSSWGASLHLYLQPLRNYRVYESGTAGWFNPIPTTLWFDG